MARWKMTKTAAPAATEQVAGYTDLVRVGSGGFSVVYRARQHAIGRTVALKVLAVEFVDGGTLRQFLREVQLAARLTGHPNVVNVFDSGIAQSGRPYIAMEYYERGSLRDRIKAEGALPVREALRVGVKIAAALATAHAEGIVHRDVKPQNILLSRYGEPALADFGTARLSAALDISTRSDALTPMHAAPEVLEGAPADERADLYSLGSTLYHLLAGRPAYQAGDEGPAAFLLQVLTRPVPPLTRADVPDQVRREIERAMSRDPDRRHASAAELARALQEAQRASGLAVTEIPELGDAAIGSGPGDGAMAIGWAPPASPDGFGAAAEPESRAESAPAVLVPERLPPATEPAAPEPVAAAPEPVAAAAEPAPEPVVAVTEQEPESDPSNGDDLPIAGSPLSAVPWTGTETITGVRFAALGDSSAPTSEASTQAGGTGQLRRTRRSRTRTLVSPTFTAPTEPARPPRRPRTSSTAALPTSNTAAASPDPTPDILLAAPPDLASTTDQDAESLGNQSRRERKGRSISTVLAMSAAVVAVSVLGLVLYTAVGHGTQTGQRSAPPTSSPEQPRVNVSGAGAPSSTAVATSGAGGAAVPQVPADLTVQVIGDSATVSWHVTAGSDFPLVLQQTPQGAQALVPLDPTATAYTAAGLNPSDRYCFRVGTVITVGASAGVLWSNLVCTKP